MKTSAILAIALATIATAAPVGMFFESTSMIISSILTYHQPIVKL
jgi:hypothetical protein